MSRVKKGKTARQKHQKILKLAKGYRHGRSRVFRRSKEAVIRAGQHAYRSRRTKKRTFRGLWIIRLNAALRPFDLNYSRFINGLKKAKIDLNRKVLSQLAAEEPEEFAALVKKVQKVL